MSFFFSLLLIISVTCQFSLLPCYANTFHCNSDNECSESTLYCTDNEACYVECTGKLSCNDANIYANSATSLTVDCIGQGESDEYACGNVNIYSNSTTSLDVNCDKHSCDYANINGDNAGSLVVTCPKKSCDYANIYVNHATSLELDCGKQSCNGVNIYGGSAGSLILNCIGEYDSESDDVWKPACNNANIYGNNATNLVLTCNVNSCDNTVIVCPFGICEVQCLDSYSCSTIGTTIDATQATTFICSGYCQQNINTIITRSPTKSPSIHGSFRFLFWQCM